MLPCWVARKINDGTPTILFGVKELPRTRQEKPHLIKIRGKWHIEYFIGGIRKRISTGTSDEQSARRVLIDFEDKSEKLAPLTVAQALDRYESNRTGQVVALSRLQEAARALKAGIGHLRINQLTQARWKDYADNRLTRPRGKHAEKNHTPKPVAPGTLRREFNVLLAALNLAWKDGFLDKPPSIQGPQAAARRERYLTKPEARAMLDACITDHVRVFLALALYTGARKGSILALTWDRVNFTNGIVDFQEPERVLTGKRRAIVPMNKSLRAVLEAAAQKRDCDYVVSWNGKPVPTGLRWSFKKLSERAALSWVPTPHYIKHSVVSWLAMERVPIDQAADLVATDPATLRRVYRKFDPAYLRDVADALEL